jgi:hypothetical protein
MGIIGFAFLIFVEKELFKKLTFKRILYDKVAVYPLVNMLSLICYAFIGSGFVGYLHMYFVLVPFTNGRHVAYRIEVDHYSDIASHT